MGIVQFTTTLLNLQKKNLIKIIYTVDLLKKNLHNSIVSNFAKNKLQYWGQIQFTTLLNLQNNCYKNYCCKCLIVELYNPL